MQTITTKSAAEMLQTSVDTVVRLIRDGELIAERLRPRSPYRISEDSLADYAKRKSVALKQPQPEE
jgi:excisionase family DNA binding protein